MTLYLSLLIAIIGALLYFIAANPKVQEVGRIFLAVGLLAFLLVAWPHIAVTLGTR